MITFAGGCAQKFSEALRGCGGGEMWRRNVVSTSKVPGRKMLLEKLIIPWSTWKNLPSMQVELENEYLNGSSSQ